MIKFFTDLKSDEQGVTNAAVVSDKDLGVDAKTIQVRDYCYEQISSLLITPVSRDKILYTLDGFEALSTIEDNLAKQLSIKFSFDELDYMQKNLETLLVPPPKPSRTLTSLLDLSTEALSKSKFRDSSPDTLSNPNNIIDGWPTMLQRRKYLINLRNISNNTIALFTSSYLDNKKELKLEQEIAKATHKIENVIQTISEAITIRRDLDKSCSIEANCQSQLRLG